MLVYLQLRHRIPTQFKRPEHLQKRRSKLRKFLPINLVCPALLTVDSSISMLFLFSTSKTLANQKYSNGGVSDSNRTWPVNTSLLKLLIVLEPLKMRVQDMETTVCTTANSFCMETRCLLISDQRFLFNLATLTLYAISWGFGVLGFWGLCWFRWTCWSCWFCSLRWLCWLC